MAGKGASMDLGEGYHIVSIVFVSYDRFRFCRYAGKRPSRHTTASSALVHSFIRCCPLTTSQSTESVSRGTALVIREAISPRPKLSPPDGKRSRCCLRMQSVFSTRHPQLHPNEASGTSTPCRPITRSIPRLDKVRPSRQCSQPAP